MTLCFEVLPMFTMTLFALSTVAAVQTGLAPDHMVRHADRRPAIASSRPVPAHATAEIRADVRGAAEHLDSARRAMSLGAFDLARREFRLAATIERDAGRLSVDAMTGLASALYAQSYNREAAMTMEQLSNDALRLGDPDAEALALADAIWLYADAGQRVAVRTLTQRLRTLMRDTPLSVETRKALKARIG
ncbi:MAG: hypothetical protein IPP90_04610 [Gemmatimonadaceae bacterium]|nr:hypothetical protein [Gemmatimonadaceae bacterium]